jgi:hypothetical protein
MTADVMDVLLVSTSPVLHARHVVNDHDKRTWPVHERVDLLPGRGLRIDLVDHELAETVMTECEPKAMSKAFRQWGCAWGFFRDSPPNPDSYSWDPDHVILTAVVLSRLVQPNVINTEYAARLVRRAGQPIEVHPGPVTGPSAAIYAHDSLEKRFLTKSDALALARLLEAYYSIGQLPPRVSNAMWAYEHLVREESFNKRFVSAATALESLTHEGRSNSGWQFRRTSLLASEMGVSLSLDDTDIAFDLRSHVAHGGRFATLLDAADDMHNEKQQTVMTDLLLKMEETLRRSVRRAIEDDAFRSLLDDPKAIVQRWAPPQSKPVKFATV